MKVVGRVTALTYVQIALYRPCPLIISDLVAIY